MNELVLQLLKRFGMESPVSEGPVKSPPVLSRLLGTDPMTPDDEPYLRQYLGIPKNGGLIPTDARPSVNPWEGDNLPWYTPTQNPIARFLGPEGTINAEGIEKLRIGETIPLDTGAVPGLGHYEGLIERDTSGPYTSVRDTWDFRSPVVSTLVRVVMERLGTPFHVYGRYPLVKTKNGYRPHSGAEDIELPAGR